MTHASRRARPPRPGMPYRRARLISQLTFGIGVLIVACAVAVALLVFHRDRQQQARAAARTVREYTHIRRLPRHYLGVVSDASGGVGRFESAVGIRANITARYITWGTKLPVTFIRKESGQGVATLIVLDPARPGPRPGSSLVPVRLQSIAAGADDHYLRQLRAEIHGMHGGKILLSFGPEMNGTWYSWGYTHASHRAFVAAYRHVHHVVGRRDVRWVWQISHGFRSRYLSSESIRKLWPGSRYVNLVGIDGYFELRTDSFGSLFGHVIRRVRSFTSVPIMIAETGIGPVAHQVTKIPDLFAGVRRLHLAGFIWFNVDQKPPRGPLTPGWRIHHQDWMIRRGSAAARSFRHQAARNRWSRRFAKPASR